MSALSNEDYLAEMAAYDHTPLLHSVLFEAIEGPDRPIFQAPLLRQGILRLAQIEGVTEVRVAHDSLDSPYTLEEIVLEGNVALQSLRTAKEHNALLGHASNHTNWIVVDRAVPVGYLFEKEQIQKANAKGADIVMNNLFFRFSEDTETESQHILESVRDFMADGKVDIVPESAFSLDRRKGLVGVVRTAWSSLALFHRAVRQTDRAILDEARKSGITVRSTIHRP